MNDILNNSKKNLFHIKLSKYLKTLIYHKHLYIKHKNIAFVHWYIHKYFIKILYKEGMFQSDFVKAKEYTSFSITSMAQGRGNQPLFRICFEFSSFSFFSPNNQYL